MTKYSFVTLRRCATSPLHAAWPVLLGHLDGLGRGTGEVVGRVGAHLVARVLAEHFSVLAVATLLATSQVHRNVVEVVESVERRKKKTLY